ncbi:hypothetical protein CTAYLR_005570 [Chrysophaeum taylorii]|uniref:RING-type E3 ubiquitin transferase n=1 Tax=Chrysophaeum taylorii TaxID=2483200 RepID=A0AAD7XG75_9STRA|nr:hypothetical protein CTAYLR_005570 [Chrysophaeum taylorii]
MASAAPSELKAVTPYLKRAEELDNAESPEAQVVAFYCRQYAMELGIALRGEAGGENGDKTQAFLLSLMERLEASKPEVSKEDGEQIVYKFASDVFDRADAEDRGGRATKSTARTFYAASIFFDTLKQFGDRGHEVDEKCRYAKWKAADILKALKEGRAPSSGGPADLLPPIDQPDPPPYADIPPVVAPSTSPVAATAPSMPVVDPAPPVVVPAPPVVVPAPPSAPPRLARGETSEAQIADAIEYSKFAIAALEARDIPLAAMRLQAALTTLGGNHESTAPDRQREIPQRTVPPPPPPPTPRTRQEAAPPQRGPPPASSVALSRLPQIRVRAAHLDEETTACCICLEDHVVNSMVTRMPCGHLFHSDCLTDWLSRHCSCPVCRFEIGTDVAGFELGRAERNRRNRRFVRIRRTELDELPVKAVRDLLAAAGESERMRTCLERADLVELAMWSDHVAVIEDRLVATRAEVDKMATAALLRLAKRASVLPTRGFERSDLIQALLDSGEMVIRDDDGGTR